MKNILFAFSLLILLAASCSLERKEINAVLDRADSIMIAQPDSALHLLDSIAEEKNSFPRAQLMRYELLRADAQNKAYVDFTTDSVMKEVVEWYDSHGTPNEQMRAHYLLGCTYRDLGDAPMELQCFLDATEKADTASADCDLYTLSAIYGQMANIYDNQYLPQEELEVLEKCEQTDMRLKDTLSAIKAYELRIRAYYLLDNQDSILEITRIAHSKYLELGYPEMAARMLAPAISVLIDRKQYDEAWKYMDLFDKYVNCHKDTRTYNKTIIINHDKGVLLLSQNKIDSALNCFQKLLDADKKEEAYHGFLLLYEKTHQPDSIAKYAKLFAEANDSSYIGTNAEVIAQMTAMYDYSRQEKIAAEKEREANIYSNVASLSAMLIIMILVFSYYVYTQKDRARRRELANLNHNYLLAINRYESLKNELIHESDTLTEKEEELSSLRSEIATLHRRYEQLNSTARKVAIKESPVYCKFADQLLPNAQPIRKSDWTDLEALILQCLPTFHDSVIGRDILSNDEKQLVVLTRLGFTPTEISVIMNKSTQRISNLRSSANKKLFGDSSARMLKENLAAM